MKEPSENPDRVSAWDKYVEETTDDVMAAPVLKKKGFENQIGGTHYQDLRVQPMYYSEMNDLNANAHSIIKYASRAGKKLGESFFKDIDKIRHCCDLWEDIYEAKTGQTRKDYDDANT